MTEPASEEAPGPGYVRACDRSIAIGGLMRCCTDAIRQSTHWTRVRSRMGCGFCNAYMYVGEDGYWHWDGVQYVSPRM